MSIDIQIYPHGVALIYGPEFYDENLPGQLNIDNASVDKLHDLLVEALANRKGYEIVTTKALDAMPGDLLWGDRDFKVKNTLLGASTYYIECENGELQCDPEQQIQVWRVIQ